MISFHLLLRHISASLIFKIESILKLEGIYRVLTPLPAVVQSSDNPIQWVQCRELWTALQSIWIYSAVSTASVHAKLNLNLPITPS
jgi:hypothetical protein